MRLFLARKQSGRLVLFSSQPVRVRSVKMKGNNTLGTWEPTAGWGVEVPVHKSKGFPEVTWEGGPVEVEVRLVEE